MSSPRIFTTLSNDTRKEAASMSVFCRDHPLASLRPRLAAGGIVTARDLRRIPSGQRVRITGILVLVHTPPTKSGKRVIFITMEDETGIMDLVAFPRAQVDYAKAIWTSEVLTVEGKLQRQGKNGLSISIVLEKIFPELSGPLSKLLVPSSQNSIDREQSEEYRKASQSSKPTTISSSGEMTAGYHLETSLDSR
jgi:DNA polymerase III alpha subunit